MRLLDYRQILAKVTARYLKVAEISDVTVWTGIVFGKRGRAATYLEGVLYNVASDNRSHR